LQALGVEHKGKETKKKEIKLPAEYKQYNIGRECLSIILLRG